MTGIANNNCQQRTWSSVALQIYDHRITPKLSSNLTASQPILC